MLHIKAKIIHNKKIYGRYYRLRFDSAAFARQSQPGQFLTIRINASVEPLLRRPFSIHRINGKSVEILYEVLGAGTALLSQKKPGRLLDIIGPLGNGFDYSPVVRSQRPLILVAGGMGVAPLVFLSEKMVTRSRRHRARCKPLVLIGAKTRSHILCEKEFKELGCEVKIATDDGSRGFKGYVSDLLRDNLRVSSHGLQAEVYACGPRPMLREIATIAKKQNITAWISLEEHMACGIGVCLGCAVNTKKGFRRVCKEGPVFEAKDIVW